jgi:N-acyl-D-aspartate/D-glutamate deacylase
VVEAVREALDTGRRAGVSTVISHHKCVGRRNYGRTIETLDLIRRGAETGDVAIDVYPYTASATSLLPDFVDHADSILISWSETHPEWAGRTLDDAAASWGCDRRAAAARLDPAGAVYFQIDEADLCRVLAHERSMIGSDGIAGRGLPHPRLWGTFPRVLARYVRESGLLTLTDAIHKMTGLPASVFGLDGRGLIAVGAAADLVLFDPVTIEDAASYEEPEQPARGLSHVFVNGELTWTDGAHTGARAGRFITRRLTGVATR